ncbi:MAG: hypothetical protein QXN55_08245 [Candidatus Nitrosotenuis sp.]
MSGNLQVDVLPPISNPECKNVTLLYDVKSGTTKDNFDARIEFQVLNKLYRVVPHSSIEITIKNGNDALFDDKFHTHSGYLNVYLQKNNGTDKWNYVARPNEHLTGNGHYNNDEIFVIQSPYSKHDRYDVVVSLFTVYDDNYSYSPKDRPKFEFNLLVDGNGNISEDRNNLLPIKKPDTKNTTKNFIGNDLVSPPVLSPLKQFKSGIPIEQIQCKQGLMLVKKYDNTPACIMLSSLSELNFRKVVDCVWNCTIPIPANRIDKDKTIIGSAPTQWHTGKILWLNTSYPSSGTGTVRVIDPDMNLDSNTIDEFIIQVSAKPDSTNKNDWKDVVVRETDKASGIFDGMVFFSTTGDTPGNRLEVSSGDTVVAKYRDNTLPHPLSVNYIEITNSTSIK